MQFDKEKAIKILTDELCYAYCDNCKNSKNIDYARDTKNVWNEVLLLLS